MVMPERKYQGPEYRFGFNGQEKSSEIKGDGNSYTAEYWEYDPRVGRRWNLDPKQSIEQSLYASLNNNPIVHYDILGDSAESNFLDKDGKLIKHTDDGSNAVFQQKGKGTTLHYEFVGYDQQQGAQNVITWDARVNAVAEQQTLNINNPALQQNAEGQNETHCNQSTQNIMHTLASIDGDKSILLLGNANNMIDQMNGLAAYYFKVAQNTAKQNAINGGVSIIGFRAPNDADHGHILTYSVGENIKKGETANVGNTSTTGFNSVNTTVSKTRPKTFYILTHVQVLAPVTVTPSNNKQSN
jgi:hypothetical protein